MPHICEEWREGFAQEQPVHMSQQASAWLSSTWQLHAYFQLDPDYPVGSEVSLWPVPVVLSGPTEEREPFMRGRAKLRLCKS